MYQQQYANAAYVPGDDCRALFAVTKTQSCFARDEAKEGFIPLFLYHQYT